MIINVAPIFTYDTMDNFVLNSPKLPSISQQSLVSVKSRERLPSNHKTALVVMKSRELLQKILALCSATSVC